jgi:hypothetical protein
MYIAPLLPESGALSAEMMPYIGRSRADLTPHFLADLPEVLRVPLDLDNSITMKN